MKKIFLFTIIFQSYLGIVSGQDTWVRLFSEEYFYTVDVVFNNAMTIDANYIYFVSSSSFPLNDPNYTDFSLKSVFYKVDMAGNLISKKYLSEGFNPYWYGAPSLKLLHDGNLLCFGTYQPGDGSYPDFVMKLSPDGEKIWVNHLPTYAGSGTITEIKELADGSIICLGFGWGSDVLPSKAEIFKLSPDGNILWNKLVPNPSGYFARVWQPSMVVLPTTGEIMFTSHLYVTGSFSEAYATVTKLDSMGNYLWDKPIYRQPREFQGTVMELLPDGNLIFATTVDTIGLGLWPVYRKIAKMDTSAQIIWEFENPIKGANEFWDIAVTENGDMLFSGKNYYGDPFDTNDTTKTTAGNILKVSASGEILWERFYKHSDDITGWSDPIMAMELLPNGGIVAIGDVPRFVHAGNTDVMLLKLDSNGCLGNSCDTLNILTKLKDTPNKEKQKISFKVSPNPNTGLFYMDFPEGIKRLDIKIYNSLGQLVKQYNQITRHQVFQLKNKGVYFISASRKGQELASKMILVE